MDLKSAVVSNSSPVRLPTIGFGTFEASPGQEKQSEIAVTAALQAGYRLIDTAALYGSEPAVGRAIRESQIPREEIVVCTKFWNQYHAPEDVKRSLDESLQLLGLDYVDLYLMHWPLAFKRTEDFQELKGADGKVVVDEELSTNHKPTWRAMESLVESGKARAIGVSNFKVDQLKRLLSFARIKPACNQVESHPWLPQPELFDFCKANNIAFMAYSPLGSQSGPAAIHTIDRYIMEDESVVSAAKRLGVQPAQILLAWAVQRGSIPLPKSASPERIRNNFSLPVLPSDVFQEIDSITKRDPSKTKRFVDFDPVWGTSQYASG